MVNKLDLNLKIFDPKSLIWDQKFLNSEKTVFLLCPKTADFWISLIVV